MHALALLLPVAVAAGPAAAPEAGPDAPGRQALRALALLSAGEPAVADVQAAAARRAEAILDPSLAAERGRLAALLPRVSAEYRHDERSYRTAGLQGTGEVDYVRFEPGTVISVRATWNLAELVAPPRELAALAAAAERARRRDEAVRRATALFFERRRLRLALLVDPPGTARAIAEAELEVDRVTAELDALTGGLYGGRRP